MANDNRASYAKIGLTVFIGIAAIVGTLIYIGGLRGRGNVVLVETYYDKPVSGLSVGSPVNFRGVKIGEVQEISFVGSKYKVEGADNSRIYILMAFKCDVINPYDTDVEAVEKMLRMLVDKFGLRATVTASGITGMSRVECDYNKTENLDEAPKIPWTPDHVYVPAKISLFDNLSDSATKVMSQINRMDLSAAWSNVSSSVESLARAANGAKVMIETKQADIERLIDDMSESSAAARNLVLELERNPSLLLRERVAKPLAETRR